MKGLVLNLLQDVVEAEYGADAWDDLLDRAGSDGVYSSLGVYPDEDVVALVDAASEALGLDPQDVLRWFGREALPLLAAAHPQFFSTHTSTRSFLLTLNDVIHPEVRKLHPGAEPPTFGFGAPAEDRLEMTYASGRRMCGLAEGFVLGAAAHYGEGVHVEQPQCMLKGDPTCLLSLRFTR